MSTSYEHDTVLHVTKVLSITTFEKFNHVYAPVIVFKSYTKIIPYINLE